MEINIKQLMIKIKKGLGIKSKPLKLIKTKDKK